MSHDLEPLLAQRTRLFHELAEVGDFRRGSLAENFRRCGKPNCVCQQTKHPGHGPQYLLMTKVAGRSRAVNLRPGPQLEKVQREVANHQRFRALVQQLVAINEQICEARPVEQPSGEAALPEVKKKSRRLSNRKSRER